MLVTKLFETGKIQVKQKPQRIKIKHKTYRQLLGLDKPKKQIYVQSDDQNDDFLEKLLKEQEKQKKKNKNLHKKSKQSANKSKQKKTIKRVADLKKQKITSSNSEKLDDNKLKSKQINSINNPQQNTEQSKKQQKSPNKQKNYQNSSHRSLKTLNTYQKQKPVSQHQQTVKVDQTNQPPYVITNKFIATTPLTISQGLKILKSNQRSNSNPSFQINPIYNPQAHQVIHEFKQQTKYQQFKAKILTANDIISMCQVWKPNTRPRKFIRRQKLFKNIGEQERFLQSLQSIKKKKYSIPSLL